MYLHFRHRALVAYLLSILLVPLHAEDGPKQPIPDLTKGEELERINKRWAGPLGIHCGAWRPRPRSNEIKYVKQLLVQQVEKSSPSDGVLQVGDVILGADGTGAKEVPLFQGGKWAMIPLAEAITEAESNDPAILKLLIWRPTKQEKAPAIKQPSLDDLDDLDDLGGGGNALKDWGPGSKKKPAEAKQKHVGKTITVSIKLESLGSYSATAPYDCEKSKRVLQKGITALLKEEKGDSAGLGVLCLLASAHPDDPRHDEIMAKAKEWVHQLEPEGSPWFSAPKLMALSEYYMKSKDETIFPKLVAQAEHHAKGVSWFGTSGHRWCEKRPDGGDNGRIAGYGPITCSGALGFLGMSLAREAGVKSEAVEKTHKAQRAFFGHFAFKSGMGYGEHAYGIGGGIGDVNGKCALSALAFGLEKGQEEKAKFFARMAAASSYSIRQYAHGGTFFGQVFHPIAAALAGEKTANLQFREVRWHMDLKRRWDDRWIYDSSGNGYENFEKAAVTLIFYATPLKQLVITGRDRNPACNLNEQEYQELVFAKNFDPQKASTDELIAAFERCAGMPRGVAGTELANRIKQKPEAPEAAALIDRLCRLAADKKASMYTRVGACYALMQSKHRSSAPAAALKNADIAKAIVPLLKDEDSYIRFAGVRVLQKLDPATVRPHAAAIMDAIVVTGRPTFPLDVEDPLQWAHGEMGDLLFKGVLNSSLDGVDREKLIPAIRSLLQTPNGGARGSMSAVLTKLNREDTLAVADLLVDNIRVAPPGNAMGGKGVVVNSQSALARHLFEEALPLSAAYSPAEAIKAKIPQIYGKSALEMESAREFMLTLGEQILVQAIDVREIAKGAETGKAPGELSKLKSIDGIKAAEPTLKLPAASTQLMVDATNHALRGENQTTYTWRKVYGAGKVSFSPNASGDSKQTTVTFTDKKPSKYRFEVTMSDTLSLNVLTETVDVILHDKNGKLPKNKAPKAASQSLKAVPGLPLPITLSGTDPDGDDLGFQVTAQPEHGTLSGAGDTLTYTADFGHNGKDSFTFEAIDGQGQTASATVELTVSDREVGVVAYDGFDYPAGGVHGREGKKSFGFLGPWKNSRNTIKNYRVQRPSLEEIGKNFSLRYPGQPSTGGRLTGGGHTQCSRYFDTKLFTAHGLLDDGGELWFSVFVDGTDVKFDLKGANTTIGFWINSHKTTIDATLNGQKAGTARNPWSRNSKLRFPEKEPSMIVGRCVWGKTAKDADKLELYRVFNAPGFGPLLLKEPVCVLEEIINQQQLNNVVLSMSDQRAVDEIRIGKTLHSVMIGSKPMP